MQGTRCLLAAAAAGSILWGCNAHSAGALLPAQPPPNGVAAGRQAAPGRSAARRRTARVRMRIKWKKIRTFRHGHYLPWTARSISIGLGDATPQYANNPAASVFVDAPVGADTFKIFAYDEQNGEGNVLAEANVTQTIVAGGSNTISATLDGVIASLQVSLANPTPNAGTPASIPIFATAYDADGNVIVGSTTDYSMPVTLGISDPTNSNTLSLSTPVLQGPWASASLVYSGGSIATGMPETQPVYVTATVQNVAQASALFAPAPTVYLYSLYSNAAPGLIAAGPDGNAWFTDKTANAVVRITPAGATTQFPLLSSNANPLDIIAGSDGNLWFTEEAVGKIDAVTTGGAFYPEVSTAGSAPYFLTEQTNHTVWFDTFGTNQIGSFKAEYGESALLTESALGTSGAAATDLAAASDNNVYIVETGVSRIGRANTASSAPSAEVQLAAVAQPYGITAGPDGNVWFTELGASKIGVISPSSFSLLAEYPAPSAHGSPVLITPGQDGALWFSEGCAQAIGRITTDGTAVDFWIPYPTVLAPIGIASGKDGSIWFTVPSDEPYYPGMVGRLVY